MSSKRIIAVKKEFSDFLGKKIPLEDFISSVKKYNSDSFKLKNGSESKFSSKIDETISIEFFLGVDGKRTDQMVKSFAVLPFSHNIKRKLLVITSSDLSSYDQSFIKFGGKDLISSIVSNSFSLSGFDFCLTSESMIREIASSGASKILGVNGLMPNQKSGTIFKTEDDLKSSIDSFLKNIIDVKSDKFGYLKCPISKTTSDEESIKENFLFLLEKVKSLRPSSLKGVFINSIMLSTTFGFSSYINFK